MWSQKKNPGYSKITLLIQNRISYGTALGRGGGGVEERRRKDGGRGEGSGGKHWK